MQTLPTTRASPISIEYWVFFYIGYIFCSRRRDICVCVSKSEWEGGWRGTVFPLNIHFERTNPPNATHMMTTSAV